MPATLTVAELRTALQGRRATQPAEDAGDVVPAHALLDDDDAVERLRGVVVASVEREAPGAPADVLNEAAVRMAGWLSDDLRPVGAVSVGVDYGAPELGAGRNATLNRQLTYHRGQSAMRLSGARALLAPWRRRGAVG